MAGGAEDADAQEALESRQCCLRALYALCVWCVLLFVLVVLAPTPLPLSPHEVGVPQISTSQEVGSPLERMQHHLLHSTCRDARIMTYAEWMRSTTWLAHETEVESEFDRIMCALCHATNTMTCVVYVSQADQARPRWRDELHDVHEALARQMSLAGRVQYEPDIMGIALPDDVRCEYGCDYACFRRLYFSL
jgi:hypothetical protein